MTRLITLEVSCEELVKKFFENLSKDVIRNKRCVQALVIRILDLQDAVKQSKGTRHHLRCELPPCEVF